MVWKKWTKNVHLIMYYKSVQNIFHADEFLVQYLPGIF
jgi:hypothetical protein